MARKRNSALESRIRRQERKVWYIEILKTKCCAHCGNTDYRTFEWHHIDPNEKEEKISRLLATSSKSKILAEMNKCIILCRNCHAIHHYNEKGLIRKKKLTGPVLDI